MAVGLKMLVSVLRKWSSCPTDLEQALWCETPLDSQLTVAFLTRVLSADAGQSMADLFPYLPDAWRKLYASAAQSPPVARPSFVRVPILPTPPLTSATAPCFLGSSRSNRRCKTDASARNGTRRRRPANMGREAPTLAAADLATPASTPPRQGTAGPVRQQPCHRAPPGSPHEMNHPTPARLPVALAMPRRQLSEQIARRQRGDAPHVHLIPIADRRFSRSGDSIAARLHWFPIQPRAGAPGPRWCP